jgi:hypothetical protein
MKTQAITAREGNSSSETQKRLAEELEKLKRLLELESSLEVVWMPLPESELSGEVKDKTIYIYECEMEKALKTLKHELLEHMLTSKIVKPLLHLVNILIKTREAEIYKEKEKLIEILLKILP